ncbi:MAG TPA: hypothetical protein VJU59_09835, partial [Paraburkholderia sp.]|uniref:hypothetical protein n=1 Tax=Paraburkholderia sp. TaxID=1926495 RepID=UPI002B466242
MRSSATGQEVTDEALRHHLRTTHSNSPSLHRDVICLEPFMSGLTCGRNVRIDLDGRTVIVEGRTRNK